MSYITNPADYAPTNFKGHGQLLGTGAGLDYYLAVSDNKPPVAGKMPTFTVTTGAPKDVVDKRAAYCTANRDFYNDVGFEGLPPAEEVKAATEFVHKINPLWGY